MRNTALLKGVVGGVIGGLVATVAKTIWEDYFPVRDSSTPTPPAIIAERASKAAGYGSLTDQETALAETGIHFAFGVGTGVAYGVLAEEVPEATTGGGTLFATAFYAGTHGSVVPGLNLEPWPWNVEPRDYAVNEFLGHLVYGLALEMTRRGVRVMLE